ncbi:MAG: DUF433 domain-containing protein [Spirochaetota bacterium]
MWQERIETDEKIIAGKPIIKGTRISVDFIIDLLAKNWSSEAIIENYPQLKAEDITACLEYASYVLKDEKVLIM